MAVNPDLGLQVPGMPKGRRTNGPDCPPLSLNPFIAKVTSLLKTALSSQDPQGKFWVSRMQIQAATHSLLTADNALHLAQSCCYSNFIGQQCRQTMAHRSEL